MSIQKITANKKDYLDLLLLADEQEDMIDHYLERGDLFVLFPIENRSRTMSLSLMRNFPQMRNYLRNISCRSMP